MFGSRPVVALAVVPPAVILKFFCVATLTIVFLKTNTDFSPACYLRGTRTESTFASNASRRI